MRLYHGSKNIIKKPQYGVGNPNNDYGLGFYCTESLELAKEWACPAMQDGFANQYELELDGLKILNLHSEKFHVLNWIALLLQNRIFAKKTLVAKAAEAYILQEFMPEVKGYDVLYGYRADDSYFAYAKDFLNNAISVEQLQEAMRLGDLGNQIALMSKGAIERLKFIDYEIADAKIYYEKRMQRETMARKQYLSGHGAGLDATMRGMYVLDLMRNEVKNDDERLFGIIRS